MLKGKKIVIGVTGGIAAYKIPLLIRSLKKAGTRVRVVMTDAAKEFVTPLTLSTLSGEEVIVGMFPANDAGRVDASTWHITLGQWADVMVIAPATANVVTKLAHGFADNAVTTLALAMRCPIIIAPAMDVDMWNHTATQQNIGTLQEMGYIVLPPEEGDLASGLSGKGRLPELSVIENAVTEVLSKAGHDLKGKKILVTAGPTNEAIDPVRFIGNRSSGKTGFAIANAAAQRGAEVTLITGRVHLATPRNVTRIDVESAEEMFNAVRKHYPRKDAVVMSAAVADFTPVSFSSKKIKKEQTKTKLSVELKKTVDILHFLGTHKTNNILVGFALETHNEITSAKNKLKEKNLDFIVLNNPLHEGAGFETDTNIVTIISKNNNVERLKKMTKFNVAQEILNRVSKKLNK